MLRTLIQQKESLRQKMSDLWDKKEQGLSWNNEEKQKYDDFHSEVKRIDSDIKLRAEYCESFQREKKSEDKEFDKLQSRATVFNTIKRELFEATGDSRFKIDEGPLREVKQERSKHIDSQFVKPGETPMPLSEFGRGMQTRATITTATGSAKDTVEQSIYPEFVPNLYAKAWCGRAGCTFVENWRGDFLLPGEKDEPASGFIAETADYPESSITYQNVVTLRPLKVGALQPFSLQAFMQDQTLQLQSSINMQLQKEWAKKVDDDFLNADGSPATEPKGILDVTGITEVNTGAGGNGAALTFSKCLEVEGTLSANNQDAPGKWIINAKTLTHARGTLRNNVAGSLYIASKNRFADSSFVLTNVVKSDLTEGSGTGLSGAVFLVPSSVVVVQWAMPVISIDRSLGFKNDTVWTKISGYVNIGLRRPKDVVYLKNIKTS